MVKSYDSNHVHSTHCRCYSSAGKGELRLQMSLDPISEGLSRKIVAHWNGAVIRWTDKSYQYITEDFLSSLWFEVYSAPVCNLSISLCSKHV